MEDRLLVTAELADRERVSPETVKWWRRVGKGPKYLPGRPVRYRLADVRKWEESRLVGTGQQK